MRVSLKCEHKPQINLASHAVLGVLCHCCLREITTVRHPRYLYIVYDDMPVCRCPAVLSFSVALLRSVSDWCGSWANSEIQSHSRNEDQPVTNAAFVLLGERVSYLRSILSQGSWGTLIFLAYSSRVVKLSQIREVLELMVAKSCLVPRRLWRPARWHPYVYLCHCRMRHE